MKMIIALAVASMATLSVGSAFAANASIPSQCAKPETQIAHPAWYRDGGFCSLLTIDVLTDHSSSKDDGPVGSPVPMPQP